MLQQFLGRSDARVLQAHEAKDIKKFFQWVTMTQTAHAERDAGQRDRDSAHLAGRS
ncbi:MAG: hypothetical protein R3B70_45730 [Polyangiaceae bacterium]